MASTTIIRQKASDTKEKVQTKTKAAIEFAHQAERLGQYAPGQENDATGSTQAVEAKFITAQDPVIQTADGGRLPAVPVEEAMRLNKLRNIVDERDPSQTQGSNVQSRESKDGTVHGASPHHGASGIERRTDAPLRQQKPPSRTNPLFPPVPLYGPPTLIKKAQCWLFRASSAVLSLCFLLVIILGSLFTSIPRLAKRTWMRLTLRNPDKERPFFQEEDRRRRARRMEEKAWQQGKQRELNDSHSDGEKGPVEDEFIPLEGGPDKIPCDVRYYARRVGLDCEIFDVQTEDGFIIELWHLYNPREYRRATSKQRVSRSADIFPNDASAHGASGSQYAPGNKKYPVLMIHGLLQSAGAYCTNDDDSLAFFLAKSGYDVWLGNNRCGFKPRHALLEYSDPRMWAWNIRQMGVMDLPALISRVLSETGFSKLGLIAHSQGTTQTLVALAKEQRPEIGEKVGVFCALAPAAYAGPLIGKMYFKFMRIISPGMFRAMFGIHAFIPFMMTMHSLLPPHFYGAMGYKVFSFLFDWSDEKWEMDLRDRMFQFAPVYVSAESMRWWLGRECFAKQKCILATREEKMMEDKEDEQEDQQQHDRSSPDSDSDSDSEPNNAASQSKPPSSKQPHATTLNQNSTETSRFSWYAPGAPPFAFWVCGSDDLVDGRRFLRRFERGREPHVDVVHAKIIEGYEHLDVIWAMDAIEKVGKEVREVIWKTTDPDARRMCRTPKGCEGIREEDFYVKGKKRVGEEQRMLDASAGEWSRRGKQQVGGGGGEGNRDLEAEIEEVEKVVR